MKFVSIIEESILDTLYFKTDENNNINRCEIRFKDGTLWFFNYYKNKVKFGQSKICLSTQELYDKYFSEQDKIKPCLAKK